MLETQVRKDPSSRGQPAAAQVGFTAGVGHLLVLPWMGLTMDGPWRTDPSILHPKKNLTTPVNTENTPSLSPEGLTLVFQSTFPCLPSIILLLQLKSGRGEGGLIKVGILKQAVSRPSSLINPTDMDPSIPRSVQGNLCSQILLQGRGRRG